MRNVDKLVKIQFFLASASLCGLQNTFKELIICMLSGLISAWHVTDLTVSAPHAVKAKDKKN